MKLELYCALASKKKSIPDWHLYITQMETKWTEWYAMTLHVIAYRSTELLFGTHTFNFNCFFDDFNCVFMQIRCAYLCKYAAYLGCWLETNGLAPFESRSESSSRVKADWNRLLQMLAFSFVSVLRILFCLSDVISNVSYLSDLINDQNFLIFSGLGLSYDCPDLSCCSQM